MNDRIPASTEPPKRVYTMLENNPDVMNDLAQNLGLSSDLSFYDVYSLEDADLLALIPRPVHALLVIIPLTDTWDAARKVENDETNWYEGSGPDEPVIWFRQTLIHGCGLIGFIHCCLNGTASEAIIPGSPLSNLRDQAIPLKMNDRANLLARSDEIYAASQAAALKGDTIPPVMKETDHMGQHFVAYVKGNDGNLWELEGSRKGPLCRGALSPSEDVLSEKALRFGLGGLINIEKANGGDLRFSCIALAPKAGTN